MQVSVSEKGQVWKLGFTGASTDVPLISALTRSFNLDINILHADVEEIQGESIGNLIVGVEAESSVLEKARSYVEEQRVDLEVIEHVNGN